MYYGIVKKKIEDLYEFPGIWLEYEYDKDGVVDSNGTIYLVTRSLDIVDVKDGCKLSAQDIQDYNYETRENPYKYFWKLEYKLEN